MSRLTRDGTAEPVSRDQILRHARGQGNVIFSVQLTTSRIGNLTRLIHTLLYVMTIHTYIHTYIQGGKCLLSTQKQSGKSTNTEQVQSFTYLRGTVTETPDMSVEIARRIRACWKRIRRYLRELHDQPKVVLSLKTRMVKVEASSEHGARDQTIV